MIAGGAAGNFLYDGDMAADGYVQVSLDNRGTPSPKGREWRKSIVLTRTVATAR